MLDIWTVKSGHSLGTFEEGAIFKLVSGIDSRIALPLKSGVNLSSIKFSVISGKLPGGLRLENNFLVGTLYEVAATTNFSFVIRAANSSSLSDRTFNITVNGPDGPTWVTPEGNLPVGIMPTKTATIVSAQRVDNIITLTTDVPHNFIYDNLVKVETNNQTVNVFSVELLRIPYFAEETTEQYRARTKNLISYRKNGPNFSSTPVSGTISIIKSPITFVLDNSYIDYTLQAVDPDIRAGGSLEYFIEEGFGQLPPGLTLSRSGRITGFVEPILSLEVTARNGTFDSNLFDAYPYDFGEKQNVGIAGYENVYTPKKLNRFWEFYVTVSDGALTSQRKFNIYVVGDDALRTDNTILQVGDGAYSADVTYLRSPIWTTPADLGIRRANNNVTIMLDAFDPNPNVGPVDYRLESTNANGSPSILPKGLYLDTSNGELFGFVPYQPAVTETYNFTVSVIKYDKENITAAEVQIVIARDINAGVRSIPIRKLPLEDQTLITNDSFRIGNYVYRITEYVVTQDTYDIIKIDVPLKNNLLENFVVSKIYYQLISEEFTTRKSSKTFTIKILGEIESTIQYLTLPDLGNIRANFPSKLSIRATTTVEGGTLTYSLVNGKLPPGLELIGNGDIIGKPRQFGNITYRSFWKTGKSYIKNDVVRYQGAIYICIQDHTSAGTLNLDKWETYSLSVNINGLTTFDDRTTTFDSLTQTLDRLYTFTILAKDQLQLSAIERTFTLFVSDPDIKLFSNIYAKPFPSIANRNMFDAFITNIDIFTPSKIYRIGDPLFGVQKELKMLVFAGIETLGISKYIPAISLNAKRKRFRLGQIKKAVAKKLGSEEAIYEVIYIEVFDDYEKGFKTAPRFIKLNQRSNSPIKINQTTMNGYHGKIGTNSNDIVSYTNSEIEYFAKEDQIERFRPNGDVLRADSKNVKVSSRDLEIAYPSSIANIRKNINEIKNNGVNVDVERLFLPEWMLTPQDRRTPATGFIKAVPLCYCNPGDADYILENIENSGFDFTALDFEIDRFIIDAVDNNNNPQYLKLPNYKFNI